MGTASSSLSTPESSPRASSSRSHHAPTGLDSTIAWSRSSMIPKIVTRGASDETSAAATCGSGTTPPSTASGSPSGTTAPRSMRSRPSRQVWARRSSRARPSRPRRAASRPQRIFVRSMHRCQIATCLSSRPKWESTSGCSATAKSRSTEQREPTSVISPESSSAPRLTSRMPRSATSSGRCRLAGLSPTSPPVMSPVTSRLNTASRCGARFAICGLRITTSWGASPGISRNAWRIAS